MNKYLDYSIGVIAMILLSIPFAIKRSYNWLFDDQIILERIERKKAQEFIDREHQK